MSKEIQSIFAFIGGCAVIWTIILLGWKGLILVFIMVALYYITDVIMFVVFFVGVSIYIIFNKFRGVPLEDSMKLIEIKLAKEDKGE